MYTSKVRAWAEPFIWRDSGDSVLSAVTAVSLPVIAIVIMGVAR